MRLQKLERLEQAAKRQRFVLVPEAPFSGRYHQIVAALNQDSRAALDRRTAYVRAAVERFNSRLPRDACKALITEVKDSIGDTSRFPERRVPRKSDLPSAGLMN
jgi:putative transposase